MSAFPSAEELLATGRRRTGLTDIGDPSFMAALDVLLRSINAEGSVTPEGLAAGTERFLRLIVNRLRFEADCARERAIGEQRLAPPLIIDGLPRVGSTKLHRLLAEGGDFQSMLFWQVYNPAPFPDARAGQSDPRIAEAARFLEWRSRLSPAADAAHHIAALEPEEDTYLLEFTLHTYWPTSYYNVPSFLRWLAGQDRGAAFGYLARLLQYLQWQFHRGTPRPWLLKSPPNLGYEREMARSLPGARFVMLHRDPVDIVPSAVAIVRETRRLYSGGIRDLRPVGEWSLAEYGAAMARHMQWRAQAPSGSVIDIAYEDVLHDERSVITRIYEHCGLELTAAALQRMLGWSAANAQHQHGQHVYSLEESQLTRERIEAAFDPYLRAYGAFLGR
jgi:hypothetical protein